MTKTVLITLVTSFTILFSEEDYFLFYPLKNEENYIESNKSLLEDPLDPPIYSNEEIPSSTSQISNKNPPKKQKEKEAFVPSFPSTTVKITDLTFRHREARGIGYPVGYSTAELFYLPESDSNWFGLVDLAAHLFNNGKWGANIGAGVRRFFDCASFSAGLNIYWDWKESQHTQFQEMSLGLDLLFPNWGLYTNVYAPLTHHKKAIQTKFSHFQGHNAFFTKKYELDPWGVDFGGTYCIYRSKSFSNDVAFTGYFFQGDYGEKIYGALGKVQLKLKSIFLIEGQISYDNQFKFIPQVEIALTLPFGSLKTSKNDCNPSCIPRNYCTSWYAQKPNRFEIPVTFSHKEESIACHPLTGDPLTFYFVDSSRVVKNPNGCFNQPFPLLSQAEAVSNIGDVFYVFPTGEGPYLTSTTLKDNQIFAGSGSPLPLQSKFGKVLLPTQTKTSPAISTGSSNAIILANSNIISGLELSTTSAACLYNTASSVTNLTLLNNSFNSLTSEQIQIGLMSGTLLVEGNSFNYRAPITEMTDTQHILIFNQNGPLEATFIHNSFFMENANHYSVFQLNSPGVVNFVLKDNLFQALAIIGNISIFNFPSAISPTAANFIIQNNTCPGILPSISSQGSLIFLPSGNPFPGNVICEANAAFGISGLFDITNTEPNSVLIRNNSFVNSTEANLNFSVVSRGAEITNAIIQNNYFSSVGDSTSVSSSIVSANEGTTLLRYAKNTALIPGGISGATSLEVSGGILNVQSPNLKLSGVQGIKTGDISATGITFVIFE